MSGDQYARAAVYLVLIVAIFHLMWLSWKLLVRVRERTAPCKASTA